MDGITTDLNVNGSIEVSAAYTATVEGYTDAKFANGTTEAYQIVGSSETYTLNITNGLITSITH